MKNKEIKEQKKLQRAKRGLLYGALSGMFWGLDGVLLGVALSLTPFTIASSNASVYMAPLVGACLHDGFAAFWLFLFNLFTGRGFELLKSLRCKQGLIVCAAALFGGPIAMSGYLLAIQFAGSAYTMSITTIYPAVGTIFAMFFLKEKVSLRAWIGIVTCIAGSLIIGYVPPSAGNYPHFYLGIALAIVPTIGWALEGVISTYAMNSIDPAIALNIRQATSFVVYFFAVLPLIAGFALLKDALLIKGNGGPLLLATALAGSISYLFWYRSMNMTGVGRAMSLNITYALWSIVFGVLLTDLKLNAYLISGAIVITIGALLVVANPKELINLRK